MKLTEWTNLIDYGNALCATLKEKGYDVRLKPYTMYDGRKGLAMQVFDSDGDLFNEYRSGIDTPEIMQKIMDRNMRRIMVEC